ncbi:MAG TPA: WD40 repeat domain-containing protein [Thermoanaerobaculia bacterium]|nr:WD40 repeat domain-containing protein [Thermoanaerobaculia bacterium]
MKRVALIVLLLLTARTRAAEEAQTLVLRGHRGVVSSVAYAGERIVSGGADGTVRIWNATTGDAMTTLRANAEVYALAADARTIAAGVERRVMLWDFGASRARWTADVPGYANALALSPDGATLAVASSDGTLSLFATSTGARIATQSLEGGGNAVAFSRDGKWLAAGGYEITIWRWNGSLSEPRMLKGHRDNAFALAFSPDATRLVSASVDRTARLWNVADGTTIATLTTKEPAHLKIGGKDRSFPQQLAVTSAAFAPDGSIFATAGADRAVHLWDPTTGAHRTALQGHTRAITALAFGADGRLASSSADGTVRVWRVR